MTVASFIGCRYFTHCFKFLLGASLCFQQQCLINSNIALVVGFKNWSFNAVYAGLNRPWCVAQAVYLSIVENTKAQRILKISQWDLSHFIMAHVFWLFFFRHHGYYMFLCWYPCTQYNMVKRLKCRKVSTQFLKIHHMCSIH